MKKFLTLICAFVMALTACAGLVACGGNGGGENGGNGGNTPTPPPTPAGPTSLNYTTLGVQYDAIAELAGGGADIAVVEKAIFDYYVSQEFDNSLMIISGDQYVFDKEEYVMACKQGTDVADYLNAAIYYFQENEVEIQNYTNAKGAVTCDINYIAGDFGLASNLITVQKPSVEIDDVPEADSEFSRILIDGLKVGFVVDINKRDLKNQPFAGNSHFDGHDGFECLLTRAIAQIYGHTNDSMDEIFLNMSEANAALYNGTVDVLVGGFSAKDWGTGYDFSVPYIANSHVLVIRKTDASKYTSFASMKNASFVVAGSSVGEELVKTGALKTAILG